MVKRTEPRFSLHAGQKTGKKSWGEPLRTTGIKFGRNILPDQNFLFWPIWCDMPICPYAHMPICPYADMPICQVALCPLRNFNFGTLHQWWLKFFLAMILYPFLGRNYRIVIFGSNTAKMGRKSRKETQNTLSRWKIWKFDQSGRTSKCPIPNSGHTPVKKTNS